MVILNQCIILLGQENLNLHASSEVVSVEGGAIFPGIKNIDLGGCDARQGPMERDCGICSLHCGRKMMNDDDW